MNRMSGWMRRLFCGRGSGERLPRVSGEADDYVLTRRMRAAAVALHADGRGRLGLPSDVLRGLRGMTAEAERLRESGSETGTALEQLCREARRMEACAGQAAQEGVRGLPSVGGTARIELVMDALCGYGDLRLTRERVMLALASFDDVQRLEMAELWAVPEAMRVALAKAWLRAGRETLEAARERRLAEQWAEGGKVGLAQRSPAFFEHAQRLLAESEDGPECRRLEQCLRRQEPVIEQTVQRAHAQEALLRMRIDNLLAGRQLVDSMDWRKCFEELSVVETELRYDPSGVYAAMEEDSREAVRKQVAVLARRIRVGEQTVARHAVGAAHEALVKGEPEVMRTVCYWLYHDEGRRRLLRRMGVHARIPKTVPDAGGRRTAWGMVMSFAVVYALYRMAVPEIWYAFMGIPLAWCAAASALGQLYTWFVKPAGLLKLEIREVPDALRTLVVMPVLLSSRKRAMEICDHIESLGCLEKDANIRYLILGDFADSGSERTPEDAGILECVRGRIRSMNERAGREQYCYLHRQRSLLKRDGLWMGHDRKRGALMALNRLLMGEAGAEEAFLAEGDACDSLRGWCRYVLTIDSDTRFLPGALQRLIGTMAHPLNAVRWDGEVRGGYAVLQPQMEMTASACVNGFVRLFAGKGGLSTYPASVSNFWQDLTGEGIYGGKGLYDVPAFARMLEGALPEGRILSHDLIEGTLAGAALVSDVCFYDGHPATIAAVMRRLNRWTRGDWQLLPELLGGKRYPGSGRRLGFAPRVRMLDNLMRSLGAPSLLGLLTQSVWLGNSCGLMTGLLYAFLPPLTAILSGGRPRWKRALAELAVLPMTAAGTVDAVTRTLWRLLISKKHLLDWVTSADSEGTAGSTLPCRIASILMLPGLFVPGWVPAAVAFAALFGVAPGWIADMEQSPVEEREMPGLARSAMLLELAADIWCFFARYVNADGNHLPPDNVQVDPDTGIARRTSPTNIGMYLMSCAAARALGLIRDAELTERVGATVRSLERMEKWNGHLYNWYNIETLCPLTPRYVSSVDSGNLAASLLLCASAVEDTGLSARMRALAQDMDFAALYDGERDLFHIGADAERDCLSDSHYDLLASESRILSYTAMMLGAVPLRHWKRLGRAAVSAGGDSALISWSGTMFEYLMPELFMHAPAGTLLGESARVAVRAQRELGRRRRRPWGVSESGYYAFDMGLNYQYRAFGLRALSLSGEGSEDVVAPYASVLALPFAPEAAARNIQHMTELGWRGAYGLYEAADYMNSGGTESARVVRSYMAHHQGMALCALCNVMTEGALLKAFRRIPEVRALELLLEERCVSGVRLSGPALPVRHEGKPAQRDNIRRVRPERRVADCHILGGSGVAALVTADGAIHYERNGIYATRFAGDLLNREDGACAHMRRESTGEEGIFRSVGYGAGRAEMELTLGCVKASMSVCVSPEDGALFRLVTLRNTGDRPEVIRVADCAPVSLSAAEDARAHPVFRNLFVESRRMRSGALMLRRRARDIGERTPVAVHLAYAPGAVSCETDYEKLTGRMGSTMRAGGIRWGFGNTVGQVLNPCAALECTLTVPPGESVQMHFAFGLTEEEDAPDWVRRNSTECAPERAMQLSTRQARVTLDFLGVDARRARWLHRFAALLYDPALALRPRGSEAPPVAVEALWAMGISGALPVFALYVNAAEEIAGVRELIRAHEFYRMLGVKVDLTIVCERQEGYSRPLRDAIEDALSHSHLNETRGQPGGVHLLEGAALSPESRRALERTAVLSVSGGTDLYAAVRRALEGLELPERSALPMNPGKETNPSMGVETQNGYGGFLPDGRFVVEVTPERPTPAPWSNLMANDQFGVLLTERGGGFAWAENSRSGRLTPFVNDALREGWGWMFYLVNDDGKSWLRLLPGDRPQTVFRVTFGREETVYRFENEGVSCETAMCVRVDAPEMRVRTTLRTAAGGSWRLVGFVDWMMGVGGRDRGLVREWSRDGACLASGAARGVGYFAASGARAAVGCDRVAFIGRGSVSDPEGLFSSEERTGGCVLNVPIETRGGQTIRMDWVLGFAKEPQQAYARVRGFYMNPDYDAVRRAAREEWSERCGRLRVDTPDADVNRMVNRWLPHQTLTARIQARTGLYQPGGAYGFRDQLQDMLAVLPFEPRRVREHLLRCAERQFEDGDVMHWWHEPFAGVRTRISDDMLFLPFVTARYARWTGDLSVLKEQVRYLKNVEIEPGREDRYGQMEPGGESDSLHGHCMRAFRRAARFGAHGLVLMGSGDWNDGMNRVGVHGLGESVWLSEFLIVCAEEYAEFADGEERVWLRALADRLRSAVEACGWDGDWYLRAYTDSGAVIGGKQSEGCRIDVISQAWAVLAGLDEARCGRAIDAVWAQLVDERTGIIRLLTPPFEETGIDPGYIRGYPEGVRENGAQYTHAACWLLLALIRMGDSERAHRVLRMLLPMNHADTKEKADIYRVEPYVVAADIYDGAHPGRGGWTWYTGSAAWLYVCVLELLGFERQENRVRLRPLPGEWEEVSVTVKHGSAYYRLVCRKDSPATARNEWVELRDDGDRHTVLFSPRETQEHQESATAAADVYDPVAETI